MTTAQSWADPNKLQLFAQQAKTYSAAFNIAVISNGRTTILKRERPNAPGTFVIANFYEVFLADVNYDGKYEVCAVDWSGSGWINSTVLAFDIENSKQYQLFGVNRMYAFEIEHGVLIGYANDYDLGGKIGIKDDGLVWVGYTGPFRYPYKMRRELSPNRPRPDYPFLSIFVLFTALVPDVEGTVVLAIYSGDGEKLINVWFKDAEAGMFNVSTDPIEGPFMIKTFIISRDLTPPSEIATGRMTAEGRWVNP